MALTTNRARNFVRSRVASGGSGANKVTSASLETDEERKKRLAAELKKEKEDLSQSSSTGVGGTTGNTGYYSSEPSPNNNPVTTPTADPNRPIDYYSAAPSPNNNPTVPEPTYEEKRTKWISSNPQGRMEDQATYEARISSAIGSNPNLSTPSPEVESVPLTRDQKVSEWRTSNPQASGESNAAYTLRMNQAIGFDDTLDQPLFEGDVPEEDTAQTEIVKNRQPDSVFSGTMSQALSGSLTPDGIRELNLNEYQTNQLLGNFEEGKRQRDAYADLSTRISNGSMSNSEIDYALATSGLPQDKIEELSASTYSWEEKRIAEQEKRNEDKYNSIASQINQGLIDANQAEYIIETSGLSQEMRDRLTGLIPEPEPEFANFEEARTAWLANNPRREDYGESWSDYGKRMVASINRDNPEVFGGVSNDEKERLTTEALAEVEGMDDLYRTADAATGEDTGTPAFVANPYAFDEVKEAIEGGTATEESINLNINLSADQKSELSKLLTARNNRIKEEQLEQSHLELFTGYEGRINEGNAPSRNEINSSDLSQERKDALLSLITTRDNERRTARRKENYENYIAEISAEGYAGTITEEALSSAILSEDQRADIQRRIDEWEIQDAERIRLENEAADQAALEKLQTDNYNTLIGKFMAGEVVSEYEIDNMQLTNDNRADLMARFNDYKREEERRKNNELRIQTQTTNYNDLVMRVSREEDISDVNLDEIELSDQQRSDLQQRIDEALKAKSSNALEAKINELYPLGLTSDQKEQLRQAHATGGDAAFQEALSNITSPPPEEEVLYDDEIDLFKGTEETEEERLAREREEFYSETDSEEEIPQPGLETEEERLARERDEFYSEVKTEETEEERLARERDEFYSEIAPTADTEQATVYTDFEKRINDHLANSEIPAPSIADIERSDLSEADKERLKTLLKPPPSLSQLAADEIRKEEEIKYTEDRDAFYNGKDILEVPELTDIINDVFDNVSGTPSEEDIVDLVQARLDGNNQHVDSATLLNTVARVGGDYFKHFEGTRTRGLTFVEKKEAEEKEKEGSLVNPSEFNSAKDLLNLFEKYNIAYAMRNQPEETYHAALNAGATPTDAYALYKAAGGYGAPPKASATETEVKTTNADGTEEVEIFTIDDPIGGYGHGFYRDDIYELKKRPGESEDEFWARVEDAEWLTEFKDPDVNKSYSSVNLDESDAIVDKMIDTLGKNLTDSPETADFLEGLTRFSNLDDFTKSDLRKSVADALGDALVKFGGFDLDDEKRLLREQARQDYDDQIEEANRFFLVNGLSGSGQEQRQYEELASNYQSSLRDIDLAISQKKAEYSALQVTTLTDSLSNLANIDISEDKLGLEAEDLEERGRQFDASIQAQEKESEDSLRLRTRELNIQQSQIYEGIRQFNKTLANKINEFGAQYGLSEMETAAMIKKTNSDIVNQTRSLSSEISQKWASITGVAGDMEGIINLGDLGVPLSEITEEVKELPGLYLADTDIGRTVSQSFEALTGSPPTLEQLEELVKGGDLTVSGIPTLESRQIATAIVMQNLDRMNKYDAISKENNLEVEKFSEAKQQADRSWYLSIGDVSETFGLSNDGFRDAKYQYDKMFDPLSPDPAKNGEEDPDLRYMAEAKAKESYMRSIGLQPGTDEYTEASRAFDASWRQANEVFDNIHGNQLKDIARQNRFEEGNFLRASKQADEAEIKYNTVWDSLMGVRDEEPTNINLYDSHRLLYNNTIDYINESTGMGTSITPEYARYVEKNSKTEIPKIMELISWDENGNPNVEGIPSLIQASLNSTKDDDNWNEAADINNDGVVNTLDLSEAIEKGNKVVENIEQGNLIPGTIDRYMEILSHRDLIKRIESGEVTTAEEKSIFDAVDILMESPPPGLFSTIDNYYGITNDAIKREILTDLVSSTMQERIISSYDDGTGVAEFGLDKIYEFETDDILRGSKAARVAAWIEDPMRYHPNWDDAPEWASSRMGLFNNEYDASLRRDTPQDVESLYIKDMIWEPGGDHEDRKEDDPLKRASVLSHEGKIAVDRMRGNYQEIFGRDPNAAEILDFIEKGYIDLYDKRSASTAGRAFSTRLIPENWIDSYDSANKEAIFALLNGGSVTPEREGAQARVSGWSKFGNIAGSLVGMAVGASVGQPALGASMGSQVGSTLTA